MAQAAKRVTTSSLNWLKLSERLTSEHAAELSRLKGQNTSFSSVVNQRPAELPKIDFAALKKQMPANAAVLDSLEKQLKAIKIPYGTIPDSHIKKIGEFEKYNNARIDFHKDKTVDGAIEAQKVEEKWAKAPPVEHFDRQHFAEYFPQEFYDLRYQERVPDPCNIGLNETTELKTRFSDYKVLRRADKVDDH